MLPQKLEETLEPLFSVYKQQRQDGEAFGSFTSRVGFQQLRSHAESYRPEGKEAMAVA